MNKPTRLNLGCADLPIEGWINIDYSESPYIKADLTANILDLSPHFPTESVDEIYFGHGLEHIHPKDVDAAIEHWKSLLKPGGVLACVTPDFRALSEAYLDGNISIEKLEHEFIYSYVQEDWHRSIWDQERQFELFARHGFKDIKPIARMSDPRLAYKDTLQCGTEGIK